ncbi:MAG: hypothetical protein E7427_09230 [Ruminococcaceae bacterium]|nr:hypothetical protein [Oscillospiraceae bacterium]
MLVRISGKLIQNGAGSSQVSELLVLGVGSVVEVGVKVGDLVQVDGAVFILVGELLLGVLLGSQDLLGRFGLLAAGAAGGRGAGAAGVGGGGGGAGASLAAGAEADGENQNQNQCKDLFHFWVLLLNFALGFVAQPAGHAKVL